MCYPCSLIPDVNITAVATTPGECVCEAPFEWDSDWVVCVLDCRNMAGATGNYVDNEPD